MVGNLAQAFYLTLLALFAQLVFTDTAAFAGQTRLAGDKLSSAYSAYLNALRPKVWGNWQLPEGKNHVVLTVMINPDGQAGDVSTSSSPQSDAAERAASSAFALSQPLDALPAGSPACKLTLTFESTYDPHGDESSNLLTRLDPVQLKAAPGE